MITTQYLCVCCEEPLPKEWYSAFCCDDCQKTWCALEFAPIKNMKFTAKADLN